MYTINDQGERSKRYCRGKPATSAEAEIGFYYSYALMPIGHTGDGEGKYIIRDGVYGSEQFRPCPRRSLSKP